MASQPATIAFVGDLMLGRGISEMASQYTPESFWGDVLPVLRSCDAVFANLECPITTRYARWKRCWKAFRFRAHPRVVELLKVANIRFVNLANNHTLDCEIEGLVDTIRYLDAARVAHAGAGWNLEEARRPRLLDLSNHRVGVFSLTDMMREFGAGLDQPGTNYVPIKTDAQTLGQIGATIAQLRSMGAHTIVLSTHWGPNLRPWPSSLFRRFARAVTDLGVDILHGHSAHILQGIEVRENGLILYDTGDFLTDYWVFPGIRIDRSCIFLVRIEDGKLKQIQLVPVLLERGRLRRAIGDEAQAISSHLIRTSNFGNDVDPAMTAELTLLHTAGAALKTPSSISRKAKMQPAMITGALS